MSCYDTLFDYGLRAFGFGERGLPRADIDLCQQVVLIGSGVLWNLYYMIIALCFGFFFALLLAVGKNQRSRYIRGLASGYVYLFRGTPLFIQFFFAYEVFVLLPKYNIDINLIFTTITMETRLLSRAWLGAVLVLFLNTSAYSAEIFYGALRAVPVAQIEAAAALGLRPFQRFRFVVWPTLLRYAWSSYTNEAVFMFHATTLVYFSAFPAWQQKGDALYYANYFAEKTFNPFIAYPLVAGYFIICTLLIIWVFAIIGRRLNRHELVGRD